MAPANKPMFLYLTPNATHGGADEDGTKVHAVPIPAPRFRGDPRCADIPPWKPAGYNILNSGPKPTYVRSLPLLADTSGWDLTQCPYGVGR